MNRNLEPWNHGTGGDLNTTTREGKVCSCKGHVTPKPCLPGIGVESRQRAGYHWPGEGGLLQNMQRYCRGNRGILYLVEVLNYGTYV